MRRGCGLRLASKMETEAVPVRGARRRLFMPTVQLGGGGGGGDKVVKAKAVVETKGMGIFLAVVNESATSTGVGR